MLSFALILIMIATFYYDYNKKNNISGDIKIRFISFIKDKNVRISLGLNALFTIILINLPLYYLWIYFKRNNFFPYEFFDDINIISFMGVEPFIFFFIAGVYCITPLIISGLVSEIKNKGLLRVLYEHLNPCKNWQKTTFFILAIIYFVSFGYMLLKSENVYANILILVTIIFYILARINFKFWPLIPIVILIYTIFFSLELSDGVVRRVLFNHHIGNFIVELDDSRYCLLLRTRSSYYLQDKIGTIKIVSSENNNIKYNFSKESCNK